jgi:hypothetical protein
LQTLPNIQKLSLTPLELSKILTYPHPYKLGHKFLKKDQNTPVFYFLKKIKKISRSWNFIQKSPFKIHYLKCQLPKCFFIFLKNEKHGYFGFFFLKFCALICTDGGK